MADPLTLLGIGSTIVGGIGSLFGTGTKREIPPELREIYNMLMSRAQEGLTSEEVDAILRRAKTNLGAEAGALSALTEARLTREGAGTGVKQSAIERINRDRLMGLGAATTSAEMADIEAKQQALRSLSYLAPEFGKYSEGYGQGYQQLLSAGLRYLLNRPGGGSKQPQTGTQDIGYTEPFNEGGYFNPEYDMFRNRKRRNFLDIYDTPYSGNPNIYGD